MKKIAYENTGKQFIYSSIQKLTMYLVDKDIVYIQEFPFEHECLDQYTNNIKIVIFRPGCFISAPVVVRLNKKAKYYAAPHHRVATICNRT